MARHRLFDRSVYETTAYELPGRPIDESGIRRTKATDYVGVQPGPGTTAGVGPAGAIMFHDLRV